MMLPDKVLALDMLCLPLCPHLLRGLLFLAGTRPGNFPRADSDFPVHRLPTLASGEPAINRFRAPD